MKIKASDKLKLNKSQQIAIINLPNYLIDVFDVPFQTELNGTFDCILGFVTDLEKLDLFIKNTLEQKLLKNNGIVFVAYPKLKNNLGIEGLPRDAIYPLFKIDEETGFISNTLLRFNTLISLDDNYTVIGFKYDSQGKQKQQKNNRGRDLQAFVTEIEKTLANDKRISQLFRNLSQGYKNNWANYIFSANNDELKAKRLQEMKLILGLGYKSRDYYLKQKKANK